MKYLPILLILVPYAWAGEYALLSSGMRLRIDRHEQTGSAIVLYSGAGSMKMAAAEVVGFEPEDYVPPKAAPAAAVAAPAAATKPAAPAPLDAKALVDAAARKTAIPPRLLHSVVQAESAYRPD